MPLLQSEILKMDTKSSTKTLLPFVELQVITMCGIGLESTGIYHTNIIMFLLSQNYQVMMINPILTNMARKSSRVHCPKNDNLDSQTICKVLDRKSGQILALYSIIIPQRSVKVTIQKKIFYR